MTFYNGKNIMKLKDIIEKINENLTGEVATNLVTYIGHFWYEETGFFYQEFSIRALIKILSSFLEQKFISKNEAQFWMKSINCEFEELRNRIEILEKELKKKSD